MAGPANIGLVPGLGFVPSGVASEFKKAPAPKLVGVKPSGPVMTAKQVAKHTAAGLPYTGTNLFSNTNPVGQALLHVFLNTTHTPQQAAQWTQPSNSSGSGGGGGGGPGGSYPGGAPPASNDPPATPGAATSTSTTATDPLTSLAMNLLSGKGEAAAAARIAQQEVASQVAALQLQQRQALGQGNLNRLNAEAAANASAGLAGGLPAGLAQDYTNAGSQLSKLAQGFSGQLGTMETGQAQKLQDFVHGLGGTFNPVTANGQNVLSTPGSAAETAQALHGAIPMGNVQLGTGLHGFAADALREANALPQIISGSGTQKGNLMAAAGQLAADRLGGSIQNTEGRLPTLTSQALASLSSADARKAAGLLTFGLGEGKLTQAGDALRSLNNYRQGELDNQTVRANAYAWKTAHPSLPGQLTSKDLNSIVTNTALGIQGAGGAFKMAPVTDLTQAVNQIVSLSGGRINANQAIAKLTALGGKQGQGYLAQLKQAQKVAAQANAGTAAGHSLTSVLG